MVRAIAALCLGVMLLSGCSSIVVVDSDVQAFSTLPAMPARAGYRFERLPSQQSNAARQAVLEGMAQQALAKAGMQRDDAAPAYSVQIGASVQRLARPQWDDPWPGWGLSGRYIVNRRGQVVWLGGYGGFGGYYGYPGFYDMPYFVRTVSLTMRDLATHQVVYETHASHDGPWTNTDAILPVMFDAALRGFPNPPQGPRRVDIEIPR